MPDVIQKKEPTWKRKFKAAVKKIKRVTSPTEEDIVDCVRIWQKNDDYMQEAATGKRYYGANEFQILQMSSEELQACRLVSKNGKLYRYDVLSPMSPTVQASTVGFRSKEKEDTQAFVMAKDGSFYIATHTNILERDPQKSTLTHASFLSGRPAELAGLISIDKQGKIIIITNNSGHYRPDQLDMYRGIKKLQKEMGDIFDEKCIVQVNNSAEKLSDFIIHMETIDPVSQKPYHEMLRDKRLDEITKTNEFIRTKKSYIEEEIASIELKSPDGSSYSLMNEISEEQKGSSYDLAKSAIFILAEKGDVDEIVKVIEAFPKKNREQFIEEAKLAIQLIAGNGSSYNIVRIIEAFPEKSREEFEEVAKMAIPLIAEKGGGNEIAEIIKKFTKERRVAFLKAAREAIPLISRKGDGYAVSAILRSFPDEKMEEFKDAVREAISSIAEKGNGYEVGEILRSIPDEKLDGFEEVAKEAISLVVEKENGARVNLIIQAFPEERRGVFEELAKAAIPLFAGRGNGAEISSVIGAFPKERRDVFIESAQEAVTVLAKKNKSVVSIIKRFFSENGRDLVKVAICEYAKIGNHELIDKTIDVLEISEKEKIKLIREAMDESGFHPSLGRKLPWVDWGEAVMSDLTKVIVGGMNNFTPGGTHSSKQRTENGVKR